MKRVFCLILAALTLAALISCGKDGASAPDTAADSEDVGTASDLHVIFYGKGEDTDGKDLSAWDLDLVDSHVDSSAPKSAEIDVLGKKFTGEYAYSAVFYPAAHLTHCYNMEFGTFAVNAESGKLDAFNIGYEKTEELSTVEECTERATEAAKRYIDVDDYTLSVAQADPDNGRTSHFFTWTKYVAGVPTNDVFSIGISVYGGGISSIGCSLVGAFEANEQNERAVRRLKDADVEGPIKAKIAERFDGVDYDLWIGEPTAACLPDGTVTMTAKVEVSRNEIDEADGETYFYPHTSAYDAYVFEASGN